MSVLSEDNSMYRTMIMECAFCIQGFHIIEKIDNLNPTRTADVSCHIEFAFCAAGRRVRLQLGDSESICGGNHI